MDIQTAFYHARYQHIRNVLTALGPIRVAKAMTAFEDGQSNWSECFFARAFEGELDLQRPVAVPAEIAKRNIMSPEWQIMQALNMSTVIPIRFTWQAFDRHDRKRFTRDELSKLVKQVMDDEHNKAVDEFLGSINFEADTACELVCA